MRIEDIVKIISKVIAPLKRKVLLSIAHGLIEATKDDGPIQLVQATYLEGETKSDVRKMHHFGFSSHAPKGSENIGVAIGGNREALVIIASENREFRFKDLGEGEVVIYSQDGDHVHFKAGNEIEIKTKTLNIIAETEVSITTAIADITATTSAKVTSPETTIDGDLIVTGNIEGDNITALTKVDAPIVEGETVIASTGLTIAGNSFLDHEHTYADDNGVSVINKTTSGVNP